MSSIYLASYKGTDKGFGRVVDLGIRRLTSGKYSHSEICIGNPFESAVECFTSAGTEGGIRVKTAQLNPDDWDILPLDWVSEKRVREVYDKEKGCKYDYAGCARFVTPFALRESPTRWFCTEYVGETAYIKEPWRFSPTDFHFIIESIIALRQILSSE